MNGRLDCLKRSRWTSRYDLPASEREGRAKRQIYILDKAIQRWLQLESDLVTSLCNFLTHRHEDGRTSLCQSQTRQAVDLEQHVQMGLATIVEKHTHVDQLERIPDVEQHPCRFL